MKQKIGGEGENDEKKTMLDGKASRELCAVCSMCVMCAALYAGCCLLFVNTCMQTAYYLFHTAHTYASAVHWPL